MTVDNKKDEDRAILEKKYVDGWCNKPLFSVDMVMLTEKGHTRVISGGCDGHGSIEDAMACLDSQNKGFAGRLKDVAKWMTETRSTHGLLFGQVISKRDLGSLKLAIVKTDCHLVEVSL